MYAAQKGIRVEDPRSSIPGIPVVPIEDVAPDFGQLFVAVSPSGKFAGGLIILNVILKHHVELGRRETAYPGIGEIGNSISRRVPCSRGLRLRTRTENL
jgi:hypothetical protein